MQPLSIREAENIAHEWVRRLENIPPGRILVRKGHKPMVGGRLFQVQYLPTGSKDHFLVIEFYVLDDKSIKVAKDRREKVREYGNALGVSLDAPSALWEQYDHPQAVERCFAALTADGYQKPDWLVSSVRRLVPLTR